MRHGDTKIKKRKKLYDLKSEKMKTNY